jgi:hypothetical protein
MKALAFSAVALFAIAPAFADEAVVVPNDNGTTVIHEEGKHHDKDVVIEHRKPDAVVVPEERHYDSNGASSGDVGVGVDVETHEHLPPPDDDK